ncbi:MAG: DNA-binding response regulator [Chloroflexi bacterium RBG_16_57_9]|nr:MAG: DNA-binding response regulator [Chloroflexi bacterium RBG_16_57_9]
MIRVLIADDHAVVRQGLKQILQDTREMVVAGEALNGQEVLEKVRAEAWDVVVLDIAMPGRSGLDILKELKHERPKLPVLVLSMYAEDQFAVRVLKAGASGYLTKDSAPDELVKAIRKVVSGGKYVSPFLAEKLAFELNTDSSQLPHETLSDREFQVLRLIAAGKTTTEIAVDLSLSVKTISTFRARILQKMNLTTNAELIHYAIRNRLIE